ncbi:MAG: hypothetical protein JXB85_05940 [Anaerolineales bacterium]|nr:hypothetical protein [Anaerolineales bacterium]
MRRSMTDLALRFRRRLHRLAVFMMTVQLAMRISVRTLGARGRPVVFFNATTRLDSLSLNAGFALLAAWVVRLAGVPVVHFVCRSGMTHCVLGTDQENPAGAPPCKACIRQSRLAYATARKRYFSFRDSPDLREALRSLDVAALSCYEHRFQDSLVPLGAIVLPSVRWRMRVHHLPDDETTRFLYREFMVSAWNVLNAFDSLLLRTDPQTIVLFNGQFFPEAVVRWLALRRGIRVVTHEVGLQPMSGYFTHGESTAYPIDIPEQFDLNASQNDRLDRYLENRFQGKFIMAGIKFWPEMMGLDDALLERMRGFKQVVPIFTNVIFDTSQPHSNIVFPDMFTWLEVVLKVIREHPETLFVIRAHPDESRPGKVSRESVAGWVEAKQVTELSNVVFIPPDRYLSSYELIQRSKFVMIYNSTIGLEASIMGIPVLCAGKARFTRYPSVFFPPSPAEYRQTLEEFLHAETVAALPEHRRNARRFLYYQLFRVSLPFDDFLIPAEQRGYVHIKADAIVRIKPDHPTVRALLDGILNDGDFLLKD